MPDHFDASDGLDLQKERYRIAFSFEGADDDTLKDDPRYVKLMARNRTKINQVKSEEILDIHKCTDQDFNEFYPIETKS